MAAVTVSSSPPTRRAYSESHPRHHFRSPLSHMTHHMTNHFTPPTNQSIPTKPSPEAARQPAGRGEREGGGERSGDSTTEEVDVAPNESSTTTDTLPEVVEPVDFIECGPSIPRAYSTSALSHNGNGHIPRMMASASLQV